VTIEFNLAPSEQAVNNAALTNLSLRSTIRRDGGDVSDYSCKVTTGRTEFSDILPAYFDHWDDYRFTVEDLTIPHSKVSSKCLACSVQGVEVASTLERCDIPAILDTLRQSLTICIQAIQTQIGNSPELFGVDKKKKAKRIGARPQLTYEATVRSLERAATFACGASDADFLTFIATSPLLPYRMVSHLAEKPEAKEDKHRVKAWQALIKLCQERLMLLAESLPLKESPPIGVTTESCDLQRAIDLIRGQRGLHNVLNLIQSVLQRSTASTEITRITDLLLRGEQEVRDGRMELRELPGRYRFMPRFHGIPTLMITDQEVKAYFTRLLYHLGPLREEPKNLYSSDPPAAPADVGRRGERTIICLRQFGAEEIVAPTLDPSKNTFGSKLQNLSDAVAEWGQYLGIFADIDVEVTTKYGTVCGVSVDSRESLRTDLTNVGVGVSQLLPVLVLCLGAPVGSTVLVEQPELHLHPAIQSRLAEFFGACAMTGRQIVVESHSEHIVNRLRLMALEGRVSPEDDVSISFIKRDEFGSEVVPIPLRSDGTLGKWPEGFFDETDKVLRQIVENRFVKE